MPAPNGQLRLLHAFPTFEVGGAQRRFATLANQLGGAFSHTVVAMDGCYDSLELIQADVSVERADLSLEKSGFVSLSNLRRLREFQRDRHPDVLVTYNWGSIEWGLANRLPPAIPHLHIEDGFGPEESSVQLPRRVWMRRLALSGKTRIVVPSRTLHEIATARWGFSNGRVLYLPNGIDCARFTSGAVQKEPGAPVTLGTVATLRREKNIDRLLRIFAGLRARRRLKLIVAGGGPELERLRDLAQRSGIADDVTFTGPTRTPEALYPQMDVFVLTSDTEQMPLSLMEAMASGLPAAATDVGDVKHLLSEENRPYVAPATDEALLARRVEELIEGEELRRSLGAANAQRALADFSLEAMIERYDRLFRSAASGSPP